jgi:chaperonin cofactor prefoldin
MLLNEFLKQHRKVEEQAASIGQLKVALATQQNDFQSALEEQRREQERQIAKLIGAIEVQAAQIEKMSARLTTDKPVDRLANHE